ncbi:hypothetical protein VTK73DRAFT_8814 [Phialemonium thermophilum]|uniref:Uncharacterized protein n=1 Tax=Phialemonium thermophilum TaxID=223376 RepID=A0ABR3W6A5_9PEZI
MIEQGRLAGRIDQIDRVIYFEQGAGDSGATTIAAAAAAGDKDKKDASASAVTAAGATLQGWPGPVGRPETRRWDANVHAVAEQVEQLANALQAEFPAFVEQQLAA